jgi:hypothetical protein
MKKHNNQSGFGLISFAIGITAMGLILTSYLEFTEFQKKAVKETSRDLQTQQIQASLDEFVKKHNRLPCPAALDNGPKDVNFGQEVANCAAVTANTGTISYVTGRAGAPVLIGGLPVRALGLKDQDAVDAWGHRYRYAVTKEHATVLGRINSRGAITIADPQGRSVSSDNDSAVYALVSNGVDDRGSYGLSGNVVKACPNISTSSGSGGSQSSIRGENGEDNHRQGGGVGTSPNNRFCNLNRPRKLWR